MSEYNEYLLMSGGDGGVMHPGWVIAVGLFFWLIYKLENPKK
jgi:hypothetical protein